MRKPSRLKGPEALENDEEVSPRGAETLLFQRPDAGAGVGNGDATAVRVSATSAAGAVALRSDWRWEPRLPGAGAGRLAATRILLLRRRIWGQPAPPTVGQWVRGSARPHPRDAPASIFTCHA